MRARPIGIRLVLALVLGLVVSMPYALAVVDPLPAWNDGPAKSAIISFVRQTTTPGSPGFVPREERFATFDQDGTLWVEQPMYAQVVFTLDRVRALAAQHPEWRTTEPFRTVLSGDQQAIAKLSNDDIQTIATAVYTGMTVEDFQKTVRDWLATARHPRWNKPYTALIYEPMLELMRYLRANGYKTYMVTGGGQEFVRAYAYPVYGIPPEQIIGSALATQYAYNSAGQGVLIRSPKLLLMNNLSGKPEDIYLFIGRRPQMAAGNTDGDQQMLEYTQAGNGPHLLMLILHDDPVREYAYGPARGLPATSGIGSFSTALLNEATQRGWQVISMKNDWKRIFAFQQ